MLLNSSRGANASAARVTIMEKIPMTTSNSISTSADAPGVRSGDGVRPARMVARLARRGRRFVRERMAGFDEAGWRGDQVRDCARGAWKILVTPMLGFWPR